MEDRQKSLDVAIDVVKQILTLSTAIAAAVIGTLLAKGSCDISRVWPIAAIVLGGLSIFFSLLFLTDLAALGLGSTSRGKAFRYKHFILIWALFLFSVATSAVYVFRVASNQCSGLVSNICV